MLKKIENIHRITEEFSVHTKNVHMKLKNFGNILEKKRTKENFRKISKI